MISSFQIRSLFIFFYFYFLFFYYFILGGGVSLEPNTGEISSTTDSFHLRERAYEYNISILENTSTNMSSPNCG